MRIRVRLVQPFRDAVGAPSVEVEPRGAALRDAVLRLCELYPRLTEHLLDGDALNPSVNIYVNARAVMAEDQRRLALRDGDELLFLLPLTGG